MSKATAPAWQVREMARTKVLEQIKQAIESMGDEFENQLDLYRLVWHLVDTKLSNGTLSMSMMSTLPRIPWKIRNEVYGILLSADKAIALFERAPKEGYALWANLLEWSAVQIANTHLSALQALEVSNPQLIFGAATATTEVPIE